MHIDTSIVSAVDFDPAGNIAMKNRWAMTNVTNITIGNNAGILNSTGGFFNVFWAYLQNIPSYVRDYTTSITGNISAVNTNIENNYTALDNLKLNKTDQRYNDTNLIQAVNTSKLDITDQRYNETALVNSVNSSLYNWAINTFLKIADMFTKNEITGMISGNRSEIESELQGNISAVNVNIENNWTNLNNSKLDKTDQRYNDSLAASDKFNATYDAKVSAINDGITLQWVNLTNYPAACPANDFMTQVGDTITCTSVQEIPLSLKVNGNLTAPNICYSNGTNCNNISIYNSTYAQYAYNQSYNGSTFNATYDRYAYNQSSGSVGSFNATYDLTSQEWNGNKTMVYNHTTAIEILYGKWFYNMTTSFTNWLNGFLYNYNQTSPAIAYANTQINGNWTDLENRKLNASDQRYNYSAKADYQFTNHNFNGSANITITPNQGYFFGQPILGMLGSGMIQNIGTSTGSELNVTCNGLNCSYSAFEVRLISGTGNQLATYCRMPAGNFTAQDNAHNVRYVDTNCAIQVSEINNYFENVITQGGVWDFSNEMCHTGTCEVINGIGLENRRMMKQRVIDWETDHLKVVSGFGFSVGTFPNFTIGSGTYIYLMDIAPTYALNTTRAQLEYFYHNGTNYTFIDRYGIDLANCDNGTALVTCTGNNYRRYFIYEVGWNETGHTLPELVLTAGLLGTSYATAAGCLDTASNPLVFNLPSYYGKVAVPLYVYCAQRTASTWTTANLIDLREVKTGSATGTALETDPIWTAASSSYWTSSTTDMAIQGNVTLRVPYTGATANLIMGLWNATATYFNGLFNWTTTGSGWLNFNGAVLTYNDTKLNETIGLTGTAYGFNSTFNSTYDAKVSAVNDGITLKLSNITINQNLSMGNYNITAGNYYGFAGGGYIKDNGTALILGHT